MGKQDDEYEVESIVEARVDTLSSRRKKKPQLLWKYRVRWKGYSAESDTWEPIESFAESQDMVKAFWLKANTGERDENDLSKFKLGEVVRPVGPPRTRNRRKSAIGTGSDSTSIKLIPTAVSTSDKSFGKRREKSPPQREDFPPSKRRRSTLGNTSDSSQVFTPKRIRGYPEPSPEVVPDSDDDTRADFLANPIYSNSKNGYCMEIDTPIEVNPPDESSFPESSIISQVPAHRVRRENPKVKMVADPLLNITSSAISTKSRVAQAIVSMHGQSSSVQPTRPSFGVVKNKSSLLTAEKGFTKINQGDYSGLAKLSVDMSGPVIVEGAVQQGLLKPTGDELLELAGLNALAAESLPDFEVCNASDHAPTGGSNGLDEASTEIEHTRNETSLNFPKHTLFPDHQPVYSSSLDTPTLWRQQTIFGPLTKDASAICETTEGQLHSRMLLNLDSSIAIPVSVTYMSTATSRLDVSTANNTPGKFYSSKSAFSLLQTVRAVGASASVAITEDAIPADKNHFIQFKDRLQHGDLFVAMAGVQVLVFCSSTDTLFTQRLNLPSARAGQDLILVTRVEVHNYSGYAEACGEADQRRWSQYINTIH